MKLLFSPLAWFLLVCLGGLIRLRRSVHDRDRRIANGLIGLTVSLALASTSLIGTLLEGSLQVDRTSGSASNPAFIFVLSGGYSGGVLNTYSAKRVHQGVSEWESNKQARLVFSGASGDPNQGGGRDTEIMAHAAAGYGVPDSVIMLEARSRNTREHAAEALGLQGVSPSAHIAIVTSNWHMRRARGVFCHQFERVDLYPGPRTPRDPLFRSLVPQAGTLGRNTMLLHEWLGVVWYALRRIGAEAEGGC